MQGRHFIVILAMIIYHSKELQVYSHDRKLEIPFNVNENQAVVEQLVFGYTKPKSFNSLLKKLRFWNRKKDHQKDQSAEIIPVCHLPFHTKLAMCKAILDMYYFGFTFNYESAEYTCQAKRISFKQPHCNEDTTKCWGKRRKPRQKRLFLCPPLEFQDLETDKTIVVPLNHYISGSHLPKSYFSYLEENGEIYPRKYAYNVNVEKIGTELGDKFRGSIKSESDYSVRKSFFEAIKNIKELGKTYEKFMMTFTCKNICGLNRASKISLCREVSQKEYPEGTTIYPLGFDETVCRRQMVFNAEGIHYAAADEYSMALLKCPPLYRVENGRTIFSWHVEYLSMGPEPRSIMRYHRRNSKGMEIRLEAIIHKTRFDTFEEDERRKREFMEPGYISKLLKSKTIDPVPAFSTLSPENGPLRLILHRHIVEDSAIDFMKVVHMEKPYERFKITFGIKSVLGMKKKQFSKMCHLLLIQNKLNYSFTSTETEFPCKRKGSNVRLVMRDAESLPGDKLWARQCPPVSELFFEHYITISIRKHGILIYEKYEFDKRIIPIALVRGVNRMDNLLR